MFCQKCGAQLRDDAAFCDRCGTSVQQPPVLEEPIYGVSNSPNELWKTPIPPVGSIGEKVLKAVKSPLFLAAGILFSVSTAISLGNGQIPLLTLLLVIFFWLIIGHSRSGRLDISNLRHVSGVCFAYYVIFWVIFGILSFAGVLLALFSKVIDRDDIYVMIKNEDLENELQELLSKSTEVVVWIMAAIFLLAAVIILLVNVLAIGKIHKFVKTTYQSAATNVNTVSALNAAKNWLLVFGIFEGLSALSAVSSNALVALGGGCMAAAEIVLFVLLEQFKKELYENPYLG